MKPEFENHFDHDRFLIALVDLSDLTKAERKHLSTCILCRTELDKIRGRFEKLGKMARTMTPDYGANIRVPSRYFRTVKYRLWRYRAPLFAALTVMLFICAVLLIRPYHGNLPNKMVAVNQVNKIEKAGLLMEEIDALIKDPLPLAYQGLAESLDQEEDEDMMNFVVPSIPTGDTATS